MQLDVSVGATVTHIASLSINQDLGAGNCHAFTPNLLNQIDEATQTKLSTTGIAVTDSTANSAWYRSAGGDAVSISSDLLQINNISLGTIATENWILQLIDYVLIWNITRTYTSSVSLVSDRLGAFVFLPSFLSSASSAVSSLLNYYNITL